MKEEYQNEEQAAASRQEGEPQGSELPVQIALPMKEVLNCLEQGLGELLRKVGRLFIESVLESEAEQIAGPRSRRRAAATGLPLGQRTRLLCGGRTTCSHRAAALARMRRKRVAVGQLPAVSKGQQSGRDGVEQHHARSQYAEL